MSVNVILSNFIEKKSRDLIYVTVQFYKYLATPRKGYTLINSGINLDIVKYVVEEIYCCEAELQPCTQNVPDNYISQIRKYFTEEFDSQEIKPVTILMPVISYIWKYISYCLSEMTDGKSTEELIRSRKESKDIRQIEEEVGFELLLKINYHRLSSLAGPLIMEDRFTNSLLRASFHVIVCLVDRLQKSQIDELDVDTTFNIIFREKLPEVSEIELSPMTNDLIKESVIKFTNMLHASNFTIITDPGYISGIIANLFSFIEADNTDIAKIEKIRVRLDFFASANLDCRSEKIEPTIQIEKKILKDSAKLLLKEIFDEEEDYNFEPQVVNIINELAELDRNTVLPELKKLRKQKKAVYLKPAEERERIDDCPIDATRLDPPKKDATVSELVSQEIFKVISHNDRPVDAYLLGGTFPDREILLNSYTEIADSLIENPPIKVVGKVARQHRSVGFFSDLSEGYKYSGGEMKSQALTPDLRDILEFVNAELNSEFNGILVNRCKASDDESVLDKIGVFSITFWIEEDSVMEECSRTFRITNKSGDTTVKFSNSTVKEFRGNVKVLDQETTHLYTSLMGGKDFQSIFKYEVPTRLHSKGVRVSYTFCKHLK